MGEKKKRVIGKRRKEQEEKKMCGEKGIEEGRRKQRE